MRIWNLARTMHTMVWRDSEDHWMKFSLGATSQKVGKVVITFRNPRERAFGVVITFHGDEGTTQHVVSGTELPRIRWEWALRVETMSIGGRHYRHDDRLELHE